MEPQISVIVPVYNAENYLHRCIDSILAQTFKDFELLLIDDGSSDNSRVTCDEYEAQDERVLVFHKENGGVSSARNWGLKRASGKYITFCDSDDWVGNHWLEDFIHEIDGNDMVVQNFNTIGNVNSTEGHYPSISAPPALVLDVLYDANSVGYCWCKMFKKSIIDANSLAFDEKMAFCEDEHFVHRYMAYCSNVKIINSANYYYHIPDFYDKYAHLSPGASYRLNLTEYINRMCLNEDCKELRIKHMGMCAYNVIAEYKRHNGDIDNLSKLKDLFGVQLLKTNDISRLDKYLIVYFPAFIVHLFLTIRYHK